MSPPDLPATPPAKKAKPRAVGKTKAAPVAKVEAESGLPSKPKAEPKTELGLKPKAPPKAKPKPQAASKPESTPVLAAKAEPVVPPQPAPVPKATPAAPPAAPAKHSAMKLPAGYMPPVSRGPQGRRLWDTGGGGKPQRDAARRAGKSRKVH